VINQAAMANLLRLKDGRLFHREGQELEFKEQFNFAGLADYFRDFAAFANNRGGLLVFGVQDSPRVPIGLTEASLDQFNKIDPERITGYLLEIFSSNISWEQETFPIDGKHYGVFQIAESQMKPVIAKKNEGKDLQITNGGDLLSVCR
jgi:predicted HTH transcriptional regulator